MNDVRRRSQRGLARTDPGQTTGPEAHARSSKPVKRLSVMRRT